MNVGNYFLHEPKGKGMLVIKHIPGEANDADIFTKNVTSALFNHHMPIYVGHNEYLRVPEQALSGKAV